MSRSQTVLLFAGAKQIAQSDSIVLQIAENATARDVLVVLGEVIPDLQGLLPSCRLAVNRQYRSDDYVVPNDAELALIPPVSGG